jgi:nucleoredoxin
MYLGMASLFENATLQVGSDAVTAASRLGGKRYLLLYFSAHWCPPCRAFTPRLSEFYSALKAKRDDFEAVFISADQDATDFEAYRREMPFPALDPFDNQELTEKIQQTYEVDGFPTLLVVDENGVVITREGREAVATDSTGERFPWKARELSEVLDDDTPLLGLGMYPSHTLGELRKAGVNTLAFYFSASWCGPCRSFTPALVQVYEALRATHTATEFIFVTLDREEGAFKSYFGHMPWKALPFKDPRIQELAKLMQVRGIPHLVTFDLQQNAIINVNARNAAAKDPKGTQFPWMPKPASAALSIDDEAVIEALSAGKAVILFNASNPKSNATHIAEAKAVIDEFVSLAEESRARGTKVAFVTVGAGSAREMGKCADGHKLNASKAERNVCDGCGASGTVWECRACNVDFCNACYTENKAAMPANYQLFRRMLEVTGADEAAFAAAIAGPTVVVFRNAAPGGFRSATEVNVSSVRAAVEAGLAAVA